ncbi:MAG: hypothetical protein AAGK01_09925, partial [Pseudomonadota bacterium]
MVQYGSAMGDLANQNASTAHNATGHNQGVETVLRDALVRGDRALSGVTPVLAHLLASTGHSLVSDAVVARLRGMLAHLSVQLLAASCPNGEAIDPEILDRFADELSEDSAVLSHCYALAMEGYLSERLELRSQIDPILSPLLQELIASDQPAVAELAMASMAGQSRFIQSQRRMQMPLSELPAELFHSVLRRCESHCQRYELSTESGAVLELKNGFDEGASRVGLLARLVSSMRGGAQVALDLEHAGLALFASALSTMTRQPRELAVLACHERQAARLALTLRAAGLGEGAIEKQFLIVEPAEGMPSGLDTVSPERAFALLKRST